MFMFFGMSRTGTEGKKRRKFLLGREAEETKKERKTVTLSNNAIIRLRRSICAAGMAYRRTELYQHNVSHIVLIPLPTQ